MPPKHHMHNNSCKYGLIRFNFNSQRQLYMRSQILMDAHLHARFRARQIGSRYSFAWPHISRKCGSRTLVQFGFDSCSLLTNTAQLRLTQDHVLKSAFCYAVLDAIIYLHIADIHSSSADLKAGHGRNPLAFATLHDVAGHVNVCHASQHQRSPTKYAESKSDPKKHTISIHTVVIHVLSLPCLRRGLMPVARKRAMMAGLHKPPDV